MLKINSENLIYRKNQISKTVESLIQIQKDIDRVSYPWSCLLSKEHTDGPVLAQEEQPLEQLSLSWAADNDFIMDLYVKQLE